MELKVTKHTQLNRGSLCSTMKESSKGVSCSSKQEKTRIAVVKKKERKDNYALED